MRPSALAVLALAAIVAAAAPDDALHHQHDDAGDPPQPSILLPDDGGADGGAGFVSLLLDAQARGLAAAAPGGGPLAAALADVGRLLLTLHDAVGGDAGRPFTAAPLAAMFAATHFNGSVADAALGVADRVLDELAAADWTAPELSGRLAHALGLDGVFGDRDAAFFAKGGDAPPPPAPPPTQPWPSKGQAAVDALAASPAGAAKAAAADARVAATADDYEAGLAAATEAGAALAAARRTSAWPNATSTALQEWEEAKLPALPTNPNKTLKGRALPPPHKQVVDAVKPGANATLTASARHVNLTKARFPVAPEGADWLGPAIDVLTADPVGSALAPALANPVGRDPKLGNPIESYTSQSTFNVGAAERKLIDNPQSLDPDILRVYRTVDIANFASTLFVYRPCVIQVYQQLARAWVSGVNVAPGLVDISAFGAKITPTVIDVAPALIRVGADGFELNAATVNIEPELINVQPNPARLIAGTTAPKRWQVDVPGRPAKSFAEPPDKAARMRSEAKPKQG